MVGPAHPLSATLWSRATPSITWCTPSPRRRQSRRIFQFFIWEKTCSTRARAVRWTALSASCSGGVRRRARRPPGVWPPRRGVRRSGRRTPNRPLARWLCGEDRCSRGSLCSGGSSGSRGSGWGASGADAALRTGLRSPRDPRGELRGGAPQRRQVRACCIRNGIAPILAGGHPVHKRDSAIRTLAPYPHVQAGVES